ERARAGHDGDPFAEVRRRLPRRSVVRALRARPGGGMTEEVHRDDWTLGELLDGWREALQDELHTAFPARVESYDASTQTADVTPRVRRTLTAEDGTLEREAMPVLRAVPVVQPRATSGGWFVHMPIAAGDEVLVICCERDITRWRGSGQISDAPDSRMHHLQN